MRTVSTMYRFFRWVYPLLYSLLLGLYLPLLLFRMVFQGKRGLDLLQRAGRIPRHLANRTATPAASQRVWIHAVSVGEVNAVRALVRSLADRNIELFFSTTTETGQAQAKALFGEIANVFFFPLDWMWVIRRYLHVISPRLVILTETEFWPGFIWSTQRSRIPLVLINGRISDRSFPRYKRIRFLMRPLLSNFSALCMQSRESKQRILELGADPERVHLVGNLKFDYSLPEDPAKESLVRRVEDLLRGERQSPVWVCASTKPGEEELLLQVFQRLRVDFPELRVLLAPRHPHRADSVARLLESEGLRVLRRSEFSKTISTAEDQAPQRPADVFLLDSIGELPYFYQMADVVFMGGSLVPMGGQNVIEAAYFSKPILFGPHMENFREIAETFLKCYGALQVREADELVPRIRDLLRDPQARNWLGRNARKVVRDSQGAVEANLQFVQEILANTHAGAGTRMQ